MTEKDNLLKEFGEFVYSQRNIIPLVVLLEGISLRFLTEGPPQYVGFGLICLSSASFLLVIALDPNPQ